MGYSVRRYSVSLKTQRLVLLLRDFKQSLFFGAKMTNTTHMTMMKYSPDNEQGYFQVVTNSENKKELEGLGFVDHIDKVRAPTKTKGKATKDA